MNLHEYVTASKADSNLWWRLSSGTQLNLLDEAIAQWDECRRLLREACQDPERVEVGGVRCWEIVVTDEWFEEAKQAGGER